MLRSMKIGARLTLGFGLLALIVLGLGVLSLAKMDVINDSSEEVATNWVPSLDTLGSLNISVLRYRAFTLRLLIYPEPAQLADAEANLARLKGEIATHMATFKTQLVLEQERQLYNKLASTIDQYTAITARIVSLVKDEEIEQAKQTLESEQRPLSNGVVQLLLELGQLQQSGIKQATQQANQVVDNSKALFISAMLIALGLTSVLALVITRSIVKPLKEAVIATETIATGNLTQNIRLGGSDEPAQLLSSLALMQDNLRGTIGQISNSSVQLASASEEMSSVAEESSRNLQKQNDEIQQAASAVTEMSAAVDEVARNAAATAEASNESSRIAHEGRERVRQTVASLRTMTSEFANTSQQIEGLAEQSRDIGKVLDVIRAIAEQTNLLALNAAIEAARAGDAGRGFAVVADEVRALAHRTQVSTQEIEQMIGQVQGGTQAAVGAMRNSVQQAESTLDVAEGAGQALDDIYQKAGQISERNLLIASAAEEQAAVAREVDRNIVNISDLSTQSAAGANQTSAATNELARLATDLNNLVVRFSI